MKQRVSRYPSTYYRVSLKAIIRDEADRVLCVKENGGAWSLPGGGLDHGETDIQGMTRELTEEALIAQSFSMRPVGTYVRYLEDKLTYLLWIVYELEFTEPVTFGRGPDAQAVQFMDTRQFKDSAYASERLVYKWTVDRSYDARAQC